MNRKDLEEIVISKLLNNKEHYYNNFNLLSADLFTSVEYKLIFQIIDDTYQQGKSIDIIKCANELRKETGKDFSYEVGVLFTKETFTYDFLNCVHSLLEHNKTNKLESVVNELNNVLFYLIV